MATEGPPTDVRQSVRILLRARSTGDEAPAQLRLGAWVAAVLGPAVASHWPPQAMKPGALEGIVWTTSRQAPRVAEELQRHPDVLAVDRV
jgi:hypothetical protein